MAIDNDSVGMSGPSADPGNSGGFGTELNIGGAGEGGEGTSSGVNGPDPLEAMFVQELMQAVQSLAENDEYEGGIFLPQM